MKGSNRITAKAKELFDRKWALAGEVEESYNGMEQQTFIEDEFISVRNRGLSQAVWQLMGEGMNFEYEGDDAERLLVGGLGKMIVSKGWLMGEEDLFEECRVTGRESTTVV